MFNSIRSSLLFMTSRERSVWILLTLLRATLSVLDLVGILAIGFVATSAAIFLTDGSSSNRVLEFAGLEIPAITMQTLPAVSGAILLTFLLKAFLSLLITKKTAFFVAIIEARAAKEIAQRTFGGNLSQSQVVSREEVAFAIQFGSPAAFNSLLNLTSTVVSEATLFVLICVGFFFVDSVATAGAVVYFLTLALLIQYYVGTLMSRAGAKSAKGTVAANEAVSDLISVFRELSVSGVRDRFIEKIHKARILAAESAASQTYLGGMPRYIIEAALLVGVAFFILSQALTGDIVSSAATIGVFISGGFRLTAAMLPFQAALLGIKGTIPAAKTAHAILGSRTQEYMRTEPKQLKLELPSPFASPVKVDFEGVGFTYDKAHTAALEDLSFTILPGQQVAFIGSSGAGKSTIADLMCEILTPTQGSIKLTPERDDQSSGRQLCIGYVPQSPGLVSGSILQNVALGLEEDEVTEARAIEAIRIANLSAVVENLPGGIHADLGTYRDSLSGGQIQRLGLARALYRNPGLLVMDEATSALDAESEHEIAKTLEKLRGKVTVVLIAHRLNTVQHADRVFLIESGRLLDAGTFQELIRRNPFVERLVELMKVDED